GALRACSESPRLFLARAAARPGVLEPRGAPGRGDRRTRTQVARRAGLARLAAPRAAAAHGYVARRSSRRAAAASRAAARPAIRPDARCTRSPRARPCGAAPDRAARARALQA